MFAGKTLINKICKIHHRTLQVIHNDYQKSYNELLDINNQNNIGAFVDLIQGTKKQENNVVKMKEKNIVITSDTYKSVVRKM